VTAELLIVSTRAILFVIGLVLCVFVFLVDVWLSLLGLLTVNRLTDLFAWIYPKSAGPINR